MTTMLHTCLLAALLVLGSAEDGARLLASKSLLNRYAVEGRDLTLQYNIYNVGSRSAARSIDLSISYFVQRWIQTQGVSPEQQGATLELNHTAGVRGQLGFFFLLKMLILQIRTHSCRRAQNNIFKSIFHFSVKKINFPHEIFCAKLS